MTPTECLHETDLLDEIGAGRWPERAPASLRAHAAACPVCADLALVASGLREEGDAARADIASIPLPSAGQVWWRAELRARQEKALLVQRPITAVQVVFTVALLLALGSGLWALAPGAWGWMAQAAATGLSPVALLVVLSVAFFVVLAPIAVLMVLRSERQADR